MALGNLLGFGGGSNNASGISSSGKSGLLGKSSSSGSAKKVIRSIDFKKQEFKDKIRNTAPIKAWHKEKGYFHRLPQMAERSFACISSQ